MTFTPRSKRACCWRTSTTQVYKADLNTVRAQLDQAYSNVKKGNAESIRQRPGVIRPEEDWFAQKLGPSNMISRSSYDVYLANYKIAEANVSVAEAELTQASSGVEQAKAALDKATEPGLLHDQVAGHRHYYRPKSQYRADGRVESFRAPACS